MHSIPLRRRLFLWFFIAAFFIIAPLLVFYTAGYTWNQKKGIVELNGTLIVDTAPQGASIILNGTPIQQKSPVTIKNLASGTYNIRLNMDSRHSWEKTLSVSSGDVTFANDITLWLSTQPTEFMSGTYKSMAMSPSGRYIAGIRPKQNGLSLVFTELLSKQETLADLPRASNNGAPTLVWSDDSAAVLVQFENHASYLVSRKRPDHAVELPIGIFHWENGVLIGTVSGKMYSYDPATDVTKQNPLPKNVVDLSGSLQIIQATGTQAESMVDLTRPSVQYELPEGNWHFDASPDNRVTLRNGFDWILFDPRGVNTQKNHFSSDEAPIAFTSRDETMLLSWHEGELWLSSSQTQSSDLLIRKGEPIVGAIWHTSGKDVFFATRHSVFVLELDSRNGRIETELAQFADIQGMGYLRGQLYISGTRDGEQGIWILSVD
ncbi:MAG: PEGA domain-containing protein [Patescibacteria group bacterium]